MIYKKENFMKLHRQIIGVLLCLTLATGVLYANGANETASDKNTKKITIRVLDYFNSSEQTVSVINKYNDDFMKKYPDVIIEHEGLESSDERTKLAVEMASGNPPDVSYMVLALGKEYSSKGLLLDLKPYIDADPEWASMYYPSTLDAFTWEGKQYLVPGYGHLGGMYCNLEVLKEAGFDAPAKTWDDLLDQAKALKKIGKTAFITNGKQFRYAWFFTQLMVRVMGTEKINSVYSGANKTSWDDPKAGFIDALTYFKQLVDVGAFPEDVNGLDTAVAQMLFGDGQAAYWYEGTWLIAQFKQNISEEFRDSLVWTTFPAIEGVGDPTGGVGGSLLGYGLSSKVSDPVKLDYMVKYVKGVMDTQMGSDLISKFSQITGTIPSKESMSNLHPMIVKALSSYEKIDHIAYPTDVSAPSPVDNIIKKTVIPGIIAGTITPVEGAKMVNDKAVEFWQ
jgi:ABC-type glycerol-3-phosphate transport system substrate-binding protein